MDPLLTSAVDTLHAFCKIDSPLDKPRTKSECVQHLQEKLRGNGFPATGPSDAFLATIFEKSTDSCVRYITNHLKQMFTKDQTLDVLLGRGNLKMIRWASEVATDAAAIVYAPLPSFTPPSNLPFAVSMAPITPPAVGGTNAPFPTSAKPNLPFPTIQTAPSMSPNFPFSPAPFQTSGSQPDLSTSSAKVPSGNLPFSVTQPFSTSFNAGMSTGGVNASIPLGASNSSLPNGVSTPPFAMSPSTSNYFPTSNVALLPQSTGGFNVPLSGAYNHNPGINPLGISTAAIGQLPNFTPSMGILPAPVAKLPSYQPPKPLPSYVPPPPKACLHFTSNNYCPSNCKENHPPSETVCRSLLTDFGCSTAQCPFQHPNEIYLDELQKLVAKQLKQPDDAFRAAMSKSPYLLRIKTLQSAACPTDPNCDLTNCPLQHKKFMLKDDLTIYNVSANETKQTDVSDSAYHHSIIKNLFDRSSTANSAVFTATKILYLVNSALTSRYENHSAKLKKDIGRLPTRAMVFHGTNATAASSIAKQGFLKSKIKRQLYGPGHYFAQSIHVSADYTNDGTVLICEIFHESCHFHDDKNSSSGPKGYMVVEEDAAILPVYIVTFTKKD